MHAELDRLVQDGAASSVGAPLEGVLGSNVVRLATVDGAEPSFADPQRILSVESTGDIGELLVQIGADVFDHVAGQRHPVG